MLDNKKMCLAILSMGRGQVVDVFWNGITRNGPKRHVQDCSLIHLNKSFVLWKFVLISRKNCDNLTHDK